MVTSAKNNFRVGFAIAALMAIAVALVLVISQPAAHAASGEVVILSSTDVGFGAGVLKSKFEAAGKTVVYKTPAEWSAMTTADFGDYDAVVLADPTCSGLGAAAAAQANAATWSAAVDGNVIIIGTDEQFHHTQGGAALMEKAAAFVVAEAGKTGAYISLSCYYHGTAPGTPVPLLSGFGAFTMTGVGCYNNAHIVATHPALTGLTDATLSNWSCSVHEAFDSWPSLEFEVLAIARDIGAVYTAPDGTVGTPYILARGVEVISDIDLSPETATNIVGETHTVAALVTQDNPAPGTPVVGATVTFKVIAGPNAGVTGNDDTDSSGTAEFSYTSALVGVDTIEATFVDSEGKTQTSNKVTKEWIEDPNEPPVCDAATPSISEIWPPNHKFVKVNVLGVTDADGDSVAINIDSIWQDEPVKGPSSGNTSPDGQGVGTDTAEVRAERNGNPQTPGNGRVYHISFTADDGNGATCSGAVQVGVPHDQGNGQPAVDDGALYDSTVS